MSLSATFYALGYLTGLAAFAWMARRRGFQSAAVWSILWAGLVGGLAGANLAQWLLGGAAGKTVLGGIAGGWIAVAAVKRFLRVRRPTGDLFAVALTAGEVVGRLGCFFGGCCYGRGCDLPWAIYQHGLLRHPTQLYLSASCLAILAALLLVERARPADNRIFYLQGVLYCGARFAVEFFRDGAPAVAGVTIAQWACAGGGLVFGLDRKSTRLNSSHL